MTVGHFVSVAVFALCCIFGPAAAQDSEQSGVAPGDETFRYVSGLPDGISVTHTPNPVGAVLGGRSGYRFTWLFKTTVESMSGAILIEEFGAFAMLDGAWRLSTYTGQPFTAADFADWYGCPAAALQPGRPCSDSFNWVGNDRLSARKIIWYYIGRNAAGRRVKGQAVIELTTEVGL